MKRLALLAAGVFVCAAGCGDDGGGGGGGADAGPSNIGFANPTSVTTAYQEIGGVWVEQGPANWSCLNTPSDDMATTVEVTLSGTVEDFQTGNAVPNAVVSAFDGTDIDNPFDTTNADENGDYSLTVPVGTKRFGVKMTADGQMLTLLLNQKVEPGVAMQSNNPGSVSELTANALPAFIGITRSPGLGVLAGAIRDCDDNEVGGAISTVSSVSAMPTHLDDAAQCADTSCTQTFYFSAGSTSLPVRHSQQPVTNFDGLFMTIELPTTAAAFLQVWGYRDAAALASDSLSLLAEIPSPVLTNTIVTFSLEPLRSN